MTDASGHADVYTHGHHRSVVGQHARRTAEHDAAFLLPRLRPGMRLLDAGCGPGTITVGLARAVAPGDVVGVDVSEAVLALAREHAREAGTGHVRFEAHSVYALPWEAGAFDVAYAHQLLQHLSRPVDALRELRRVLVPGGLVAVRDADYGTFSAWPPFEELSRFLEVYHRVAARNGADADAGRRVPGWLREAGFEAIELFPTVQLYADAASVANWGTSWAERVVHSSLAAQAVRYALATPGELEAIAEGWRAWVRTDGALFMFVQMAAIGRAPGG